MSNHNAPVDESTGTTEVEQLKNELAHEREKRQSVEDELSSLKEDYSNYRRAMSKKLDSLKNQLQEVRASGSSSEKGGVQADETGSHSGDSPDMLPIERLMQLREQDDDHPALPSNGRESFDRAVSIFENFEKWSKKTPKGRTVTDGLKTLLETASGERLAWRQVYRAMDKVEEWTNEVITHETTSRHGHVLVMGERPSSVGTGG